MMTRDDVLRELELLPAWQLRTPLPSQTTTAKAVVLAETSAVEVESGAEPVVVPEFHHHEVAHETLMAAPAIVSAPVIAPEFAYMTSEDCAWLIVLAKVSLTADEMRLLQNIAIALQIKLQPVQVSSALSELVAQVQVKQVLAFGEAVAQHLLSTQAMLDDLRGSVHRWQGVPLVVTYDLAHLLEVPRDKAHAWRDMCLVMTAV